MVELPISVEVSDTTLKSKKSIAAKKLREEFQFKINQSQAYRLAVLLALHGSQTSVEQAKKKTQVLNGFGFDACDAPALTPLAVKVKAGTPLSHEEDAMLRKRLPKYSMQFAKARSLGELPAAAVDAALAIVALPAMEAA
jgi:hypothetical protein